MTMIETRPESTALSVDSADPGRALAGVASWIISADHKRIGRLMVGFSLLYALGLLVVGALIGAERIDPDGLFLDGDSLGQLFSLQRVGLHMFVLAPMMLGLAVAVVPLQLGARSLAFPRAAALGMWSWAIGCDITIVSFIGNGGPGGGDADYVDLFLGGVGLTAIGLVIVAGSLVTTVLTTRAPGMRLGRVPAFAWSALVGGAALLLTLPIVVGGVVYLLVDHRYANRAAFGGSEGILSWMGWALTQPTTYLAAVPALGMAADIIVTATGRRHALRGGFLVGIGVFATAVLAASTQRSHNLPWSDSDGADRFNDALPYLLFNALPLLGVLIVLAMVAFGLKSGKPRISAGFVFALLGLLMLKVGVSTHLLTPILDLQLSDTVYEEGVFNYIVWGPVLVGLGALCHWGPKLWGRRIDDKKAIPLALLGFLGVILASAPLLLAGFHNQPAMTAGGFDYELSPELLNALAAVGQAALALTVLAFVGLAAKSFTSGDAAGDDPWDGQTLEWATSSPPPEHNFADLHTVSSAEPLFDLKPSRSDA